MFGFSTAKLIASGIALIAVLAFIAMALHWRSEMIELRGYQTEVVKATREASGQPKLGKDGVSQQIRLLGQARRDLEAALLDQNNRILAIAAADKARQADAAKARQEAEEARRARDGVVDRLNRSARAARPSAPQCEPSETLKELWR